MPETGKLDVGDGLHYASIDQVGALLRSQQITPVELTQYMLDRVRALDPELHAYASVLPEQAMASARELAAELVRGEDRGPLHGIPVAVKDLCDVQGVEVLAGLSVRKGRVAEQDATVVARLKDAGAIILGTLNLTEGAFIGYHEDFAIPQNPWGKNLWPGVSSSGSGVAVAAGLCFAAIGTDTGGSIRYPSMANGVVGLKPTYGRVSRHGVWPLAQTMDHIGPMTRCVADASIVLQAIAGADPHDGTSLSQTPPERVSLHDSNLEGVVIGYDASYVQTEPESKVIAAIERSLAGLKAAGAEVKAIEVPPVPDGIQSIWALLCASEAAEAHAEFFPARADGYGKAFGEFLALSEFISGEQLEECARVREQIASDWTAAFEGLDALVCPVGGHAVQLHNSQYEGIESLGVNMAPLKPEFVIPASFSGLPTLTMPCSPSEEGPPYALQLYGRASGERALCRIGLALEAIAGCHSEHPLP